MTNPEAQLSALREALVEKGQSLLKRVGHDHRSGNAYFMDSGEVAFVRDAVAALSAPVAPGGQSWAKWDALVAREAALEAALREARYWLVEFETVELCARIDALLAGRET